jgi:hypothetical protein
MKSDQVVSPDDDAFVAAFYAGRIPNQGFHHRDHLRLAWVQIHRLGLEQASESVTSGILRFATHHGNAVRYNDTMTRFWLRLVAMAISVHPTMTFEALLEAEPHLLEKELPFRHWSRDRLMSPAARTGWVDPDLRSLPLVS